MLGLHEACMKSGGALTWGMPVSVWMACVLASMLAPVTGLKNADVPTMCSMVLMLAMCPEQATPSTPHMQGVANAAHGRANLAHYLVCAVSPSPAAMT